MDKIRLLMSIRRGNREIKLPSQIFELGATRSELSCFASKMVTNEKIKTVYYQRQDNLQEILLENKPESIEEYIKYVQQLVQESGDEPKLRMIIIEADRQVQGSKKDANVDHEINTPQGCRKDTDVIGRKIISLSNIVPIFTNYLDKKDVSHIQKSFNGILGEIRTIFGESTAEKVKSSSPDKSGFLKITRLPAQEVMESLKNGSTVTVADDSGNYYQVSFENEQPALFGRAVWETETDTSFRCAEMKIPARILENEIGFANGRTDSIINSWKTVLVKKEEPVRVQVADDANTKNDDLMTRGDVGKILDEFKEQIFEEILFTMDKSLKNYILIPKESEPSMIDVAGANDNVQQDAETAKSLDNGQGVKDEKVAQDLKKSSKITGRTSTLENDSLSSSSSADEEIQPATIVVNVSENASFGGDNDRKNDARILSRKDNITDIPYGRVKMAKRSSSHRKYEHKFVQLDSDLFMYSKYGYKLKMAPNSMKTIRFSLLKYGNYANVESELELRPASINTGIECTVKPITKTADKASGFTHDIRFKTKGKTGKFRCMFKVMQDENVCGLLRVDVRVKKFYHQQDANYFSAEETPSIETLASAEPQVAASTNNISPSILSAYQSTADAAGDMADEGIGFYGDESEWELSDSDLDIIEDKMDNANDEGIDTGFVKNDPLVNSDDGDSDSSVSLLLDENEVREKDDDLDVVKIPMCFLPNAEMKKECVPVRVKRKVSGSKFDSSHASNKHLFTDGQLPRTKSHLDKDESRRFATHGVLLKKLRESMKNTAEKKGEKVVLKRPAAAAVGPAFNDSFSSDNKIDSATATNDASLTNPSITTTSTPPPPPPVTNSETEIPKCEDVSQTENPSSAIPVEEIPPSISIIPDKVLEITSNVFKTVMNSVKPLNETKDKLQKSQIDKAWENTIPLFEKIERTANKTFDDMNSLLTNTNVSNPTDSNGATPQPSAVHKSTETVGGSSWNTWNEWEGFDPLKTTTEIRGENPRPPVDPSILAYRRNTPSWGPRTQNDKWNGSTQNCTYPNIRQGFYPQEHRQAPYTGTWGHHAGTNYESWPYHGPNWWQVVQPQQQQTHMYPHPQNTQHRSIYDPTPIYPVGQPTSTPATTMTATASQQAAASPAPKPKTTTTSPTSNEKPKRPNIAAPKEKYNEIPPQMRANLLKLNEMGFVNEERNLFFIRQYPNDLGKVVESLINYSDA